LAHIAPISHANSETDGSSVNETEFLSNGYAHFEAIVTTHSSFYSEANSATEFLSNKETHGSSDSETEFLSDGDAVGKAHVEAVVTAHSSSYNGAVICGNKAIIGGNNATQLLSNEDALDSSISQANISTVNNAFV
jgi:hypothetical protein